MSDDLDRQVSAYFEALAERVEPLDAGAAPPTAGPHDSGSSRPKGRALMFTGAAMFIVVLVGAVVIARNRAAMDSVEKLFGGSGACSSIPVNFVPEPSAASTQPIEPKDVLYFERSSQNMVGNYDPQLIVSSTGQVIAIDWFTSPTRTPESTYRSATLTPESVEALKQCLTSSDFQSLGDYEDGTTGREEGELFCAISDMSTQRLVAGPASGAPKAVEAYAIEIPEGIGGSSGRDEDPCYRFPEALTDLHATVAEIRDVVGGTGVPTDPPASDLEPTEHVASDTGPCSSIVVELDPTSIGDPSALAPGDVLYAERASSESAAFDETRTLIGVDGTVITWGPGSDVWQPAPAFVAGQLTTDSLESWLACLASPDFQALGDYYSNPSCDVDDAGGNTLSSGPASGAAKSVDVYGLDVGGGAGSCAEGLPKPLVDVYHAARMLQSSVGAFGTPTDRPPDDLDPSRQGG